MFDRIVIEADVPRGRIAGTVALGFEDVAQAFAENFAQRGEVGAAFAAYHRGELVVDLWGGLADPATGAAWRRDTTQLIFSGSKALVATCVLMLVERGRLELDEPVCRYWPEFAAAGKHWISVRDVLTHQSALPGIRTPLTMHDLFDERLMARLLEQEAPFEGFEGRLCYHPLTFGWLCGELIRRVDGRGVRRFFAEEVAAPLALDLWIGLPPSLEPRVATLIMGEDWGIGGPERALDLTDATVAVVWDNPRGRLIDPRQQNSPAYRAAGIPATGAIGTARSIARLYGCLACDGALDGVRLLAPETVAMAQDVEAYGTEALVGTPIAYGLGFELQTELMWFGPPEDGFGHTGAGGSVHGAWPGARIGFSYAMNELRDMQPEPRAQALLDALYDALAGQ